MKDKPLVSIITPIYNVAPFVAETIRSVLQQTVTDWEMILIDDGSKDESVEVCQRFLSDERIQLHTQPNSGVSAARNKGLTLARGDTMAFLDSDDIWLPNKLERQLAVFRQYPDVSVCGTNYEVIDANSVLQRTPLAKPQMDFHGDAAAVLASGRESIPLSSGIIKRSVYEKIGGFDESITSLSEDLDFWLRASVDFSFYKIAEPLLLYRSWDGNATSAIDIKRQHTVIHTILPKFLKLIERDRVSSACIRQFKSSLCHERGCNRKTKGFFRKTYWFLRALYYHPKNRDAWGALGHQLLGKRLYSRIKNITQR